MKDLVIFLFNYNSPVLLNCMRSIDLFGPSGDKIIIDDKSNSPDCLEIFENLKNSSDWKVIQPDLGPKINRHYGNYYPNMRFALNYAVDKGYRHCLFMEDDQQLLWKRPDQMEYVERVFSEAQDCIMLHPLFFRRIIRYDRTLRYISSVKAYRIDRGFTTTGFWNLEAVRKHPDTQFICQYGDDLPTNSLQWMQLGYRVYCQNAPIGGVIPWRRRRQGGRRSTASTNPDEIRNELNLRPLNDQEIALVLNHDPSTPLYQDYLRINSKSSPVLIWHRSHSAIDRFLMLCRTMNRAERDVGSSPIKLDVLPSWCPPDQTEVASHSHQKYVARRAEMEQRKQLTASRHKDRFSSTSFLHSVIAYSKGLFRALRSRYGLSVPGYFAYLVLQRKLSRESAQFYGKEI